jgi:hypothetical protein
MRVAYLVPALGCLVAACSGSAPNPRSEPGAVVSRIDSSEILLRTGRGLGDPTRTVIRDSVAWDEFWSQANALIEPAPALPPVNFADSMLLVAALGTQATGGNSVLIDSVARGTALRVFVTTVTPGPDCRTTLAITWPVQVVRVARFDGSVEFVEGEREEKCQ